MKLRMLANAGRRGRWQLVGSAIAVLYGLGGGAVIVALFGFLRTSDADTARVVVVIIGSLLVLGFLLGPIAFGADDGLDPRGFSAFGLGRTRLAGMLALSGLVGVPGLVVTAVAVAQVGLWDRGALPQLLALLGAPLIIATCLLASRVTTALAALTLATRRAREISGGAALVALVCVSPTLALAGFVDWNGSVLVVFRRVAGFVSWTPVGAVWSAPADAANGDTVVALAKLSIAIVSVVVLWVSWRHLVTALLESPLGSPPRKNRAGLGWFGSLPATPIGVIAARSFTYWGRDARYRVQLVVIPVVPLACVAALLIGGVEPRTLALLPLPIMALFLSWTTHNDVAVDNSAIWLHVASSASGVADRLGRIIPVLTLGVVLIAVGAPVTAALHGDESVLPSVIGVSGCIVLSGLGVGSLVSARFPYAAVRPGDSPFSQPQATGGSTAAIIQSLSFFATVVFALPSILLAVLGIEAGGACPWLSLAVGIGLGLVVLVVGVRAGGTVFERRGPEILAFTLRN